MNINEVRPSQCMTISQWEDYIASQVPRYICGKSIIKLNLKGMGLTDKNMAPLAEALKTQLNVNELDLTDNLITDVGMKALAGAINVNPELAKWTYKAGKIKLGGNFFSPEGYIAIMESIRLAGGSLQSFDFGSVLSNESMSDINRQFLDLLNF